MHNELIKISTLDFSYDGRKVVHQLDFSLLKGEQIGIIGDTGCGKSTFLFLMMGLLKAKAGTISLFSKHMNTEKDFSEVRTNIGFLFQDADDQLFSPTVIDDIVFGPLNQGRSLEEAQGIANELLKRIGICHLKHRVCQRLSGGEKKLVALASILVMKPQFLLLDEPVTGLDHETKDKVIEILNDLALPCVVVSHDIDFINKVTNKLYRYEDGKCFYDPKVAIHNHSHVHLDGDIPHEHSPADQERGTK